MRIYKFWDKPVGMCVRLLDGLRAEHFDAGPHPTAMFEVNTFSPHQTGVLFTWLVVNRGPCSYVFWVPSLTVVSHPDPSRQSACPSQHERRDQRPHRTRDVDWAGVADKRRRDKEVREASVEVGGGGAARSVQ